MARRPRLPKRDDRNGGNGEKGDQRLLFMVLAATLAAFVLSSLLFESGRGPVELSYSEFKRAVEGGEIARVEISGVRITGYTADEAIAGAEPPAPVRSYAPEMGDPELIPMLERAGVEIVNDPPSEGTGLIAWLPLLLIIGFYLLLARRMQGMYGGRFPGGVDDFLGGFGKKRAEKKGKRVTFKDVAGQESAKKEVAELVDFLRDPERFHRVGAEAPRGILLMGPPGTGKTLLARALAGEADVPFFAASASEFIEMFVGVGASRVRSMFEEAKKRAPSIIFLDELDSVGRVRGTGLGGGHDEREQTLNQILAELDGFTGREAVIVLAATNRPDVLDPALLRPGRFDRHVTLTLPDLAARRAILDVHVREVPLAKDVDLDLIARGTPGFSGADLKNLINEGAILAARQGAKSVSMACLEEARDKVMMGTVRTMAIQPEEKHRLATHEAGHAAVAWHLPEADPLYKVTIIPRGRSLGGTHLLPGEERHTLPEDHLRSQIAVLLAGRAAERMFLGTVSSGADDDIKRATGVARAMVSRWGMSEEIGPMDVRESEEHPFLGREIAQPRRTSDPTAARVDEATRKLLLEAEARAEEILTKHRARVEALIARLEDEETLDRDAVAECLDKGRSAGRSAPAAS